MESASDLSEEEFKTELTARFYRPRILLGIKVREWVGLILFNVRIIEK